MRKLVGAWLLVCAAATMALCTYKAAHTSFTHDEAYSFLHYPRQSVSDIVDHKMAYTNNHLLNTLAMKGSCHFFGTSELACRLPNLAALAIYLFYCALFLRHVHPLLAVVAYPALLTNVYLMEFFTLARGYGLSFGFLVMALYHLWRACATGRWAHTVLFHFGFLMASLSNFTLATAYLAGLAVFCIVVCVRRDAELWSRRELVRNGAIQFLLLLASVKILATPIDRMMAVNALDFGGKLGFYGDTVSTLVFSMFPGVHLETRDLIAGWVIMSIVVLGASALIIVRLARQGSELRVTQGALFVATGCLLLICVGSYAQHLLLGVDQLKDRFALFLLPPLMLLLILLLDQLPRRYIVLSSLICAGFSTWGLLSMARHFGPYQSWEWGYDMDTKDAVRALTKDHDASPEARIQMGINWIFEPSLNFYRDTKHLRWLKPLTRDGLSENDDYRYVFADDTAAARGFVTVSRFEHSNTLLLRKEGTPISPDAE